MEYNNPKELFKETVEELKKDYIKVKRRIKYYKNSSFLLTVFGLTGIGVSQFLPETEMPQEFYQYQKTKSEIESLIEEKEHIGDLGLKEYGKNISSILNKEIEEKKIIADSLMNEKPVQDYLNTKKKENKKRDITWWGGLSATLIGMFGWVYFMGLYNKKNKEEIGKLEKFVLTEN